MEITSPAEHPGDLLLSSRATGQFTDAATRRLWFLQALVHQMEPEKALALAARMEAFVATGGTPTTGGENQQRIPPQVLHGRLSASTATAVGEAWKRVEPRIESLTKTPSVDSPGRLLASAELQEFQDRALNGATNGELAQRFGLTPRQANGIRMGLAKRVPQVALKRTVAKAPKVALDRATELQMQNAFLEQKARVPPSIEDVVRYLRQRGDVVIRANGGFRVNDRSILTEQELIQRANEKRAQLGQPVFQSDLWSVNPIVDNPSFPCSSAASGDPSSQCGSLK